MLWASSIGGGADADWWMLAGGGGSFVVGILQVQDRKPACVLLFLRHVKHCLGKDPMQPVRIAVANQRPRRNLQYAAAMADEF